jgi:hypothetical protein
MAALTDAMNWYNLGGARAPRLKYLFKVEFYSSQHTTEAKNIFDCVRTIELPKYSIDTEIVNAWNVRQLVPTKISFEPISISFNDTLDNRFQKFLTKYLKTISNSFVQTKESIRTGFDDFGLRMQDSTRDVVLEKIVITRFWGADADRENLEATSTITLWRPKIIDIQHDTLDYSASEATTWQISVRYESVTYEEKSEVAGASPATAKSVQLTDAEIRANNAALGDFPG